MIWRQFWRDEVGFVVSSELILAATILVIGSVVGLGTMRDAVMAELADVGGAIGDIDHSFSFGAVTTSCGTVNGSIFVDQPDFCEIPGNNDRVCSAPLCVRVCLTPNSTPE